MRHLKKRFIALLAVFLTPGLALADDRADDRIPDLFALRLTMSESPRPGETAGILVEAFHPYSGEPLAGLEVEVQWSFQDDEPSRNRRMTDGRGEAAFAIPIPDDVAGIFEATAEATWHGTTRRVRDYDFVFGDEFVVLGTDKKLYRPGQTIHVRGLWLDGDRRPMETEVEVRIFDARGREAFYAEARTSSFGVANFDWEIPETGPAGDYVVFVEPGDGTSSALVQVIPFEPAPFLVQMTPRRPFDSPGTETAVDVRVTTPAGEPLAGVEVTAEQNTWEEEEPLLLPRGPAVTDAAGEAVLHYDVADSEALGEEDELNVDLHVSAHDPTSGHTETRVLTRLVAAEEIHLELWGSLAAPGRPARAWMETTWADGRPVSCDVEIRRRTDSGEEVTLGHLRTDRYGVAQLPAAMTPEAEEPIRVIATAAEATTEDTSGWDEAPPLLWVPERVLHPHGSFDALDLRLYASPELSGRSVRVEAHRDRRRITSEDLVLDGGTAVFHLPWSPALAGEIQVSARLLGVDPHKPGRVIIARTAVLYPMQDKPLDLTLEPDRETYRPGEEAHLALAVDPPMPAVLGVAAVDGAVEERQESLGLSHGPALLDLLDFAFDEEPTEVGGWTGAAITRALGGAGAERAAAELETLAEILLYDDAPPWDNSEISSPIGEEKAAHRDLFAIQMAPLLVALYTFLDSEAGEPATDPASLRAFLEDHGVDLNGLYDPWGSAYCFQFSVKGADRRLTARSAGRDRLWGTLDDFDAWAHAWPFARRLGHDVGQALNRRFEEDGTFVLDEESLAQELARDGIDWQAERDPWDRPYRLLFEPSVYGGFVEVEILSDGPNRRTEGYYSGDDVRVIQARLNYGAQITRSLGGLLKEHLDGGGRMPAGEAELRDVFGDLLCRLRDPWGHEVLFRFDERQVYEPGAGRRKVKATTRVVLGLWSAGPDGRTETDDDIHLGSIDRPLEVRKLRSEAVVGEEHGAVTGVVVDNLGQAIPGATVTAERSGQSLPRQSWVVYTDENGAFRIVLPPGVYELLVSLDGFNDVSYPYVSVLRNREVYVEVTLELATLQETITVTSTSAGSTVSRSTAPIDDAAAGGARLRREFAETLLWLPELVLGDDGRGDLTLPLADNVTTWKVAALASTADGRLATTVRDVVATLPLYVEPEPPRHLTAGDEVEVPFYLHNRSGGPLDVDLAVSDGADGDAVKLQAAVEPGDVRRLDVLRRFERPGLGTVRVDARSAQGPADAAERTVEVGFDGVERVRTFSRLMNAQADGGELGIEVPRDALPGSGRLEVVIYEGLGDHLAGALQELRSRPIGCAEQLTSMAWINLLLLDVLAARDEGDSAAAVKARKDLGYAQQKLREFQNGGFAYWRGGTADPALTAYVLELLNEARRHVEVEEYMLSGVASWLRQKVAGDAVSLRWRAWAALALSGLTTEDDKDAKANREAAAMALDDLSDAHEDAYTLALRVLAAKALGEEAGDLLERLKSLAEAGDEGTRWPALVVTPFYGSGLAGDLEATALAVRALGGSEKDPILRDRGLVWLLNKKDARGAWLSTQATVQVLRALTAAFGGETKGPDVVTVALDDKEAEALPRSPAPGLPAPPWIVPLAEGRHRLAVTPEGAGDATLVQATVRWYEPWRRFRPPESSLSLQVGCTPTELSVGDVVTCDVTAGRSGPPGYGMLIAEVGLPPGAEVDRGSLAEAVASNRDVWDYEVWADRVVVYLWPRREATSWRFLWRPRFAMRARSAPSRVYEYYNPDEEAYVAPLDFEVDAASSSLAEGKRSE